MADRLKVKANAKINTGLDILGKRSDGYHDIRTLMHTVGLGDIIEFEKSDDTEVISDLGIDQKDDITYKAIEAVREHSKAEGSLCAKVTKLIPTGAGLGGGSTDGAAAIRAFDIMYGLGLSDEEMERIALSVGSDLPFLLRGGFALCEGRGEIMTRFPSCEGYVLIVKGDVSVNTGKAYAFMDSLDIPEGCSFETIRTALYKREPFNAVNAFEHYMDHICPDRIDVKKVLMDTGAFAAGLSGSGACWWALYEDRDSAETALGHVKDMFSLSYVAAFCENSFEILWEE